MRRILEYWPALLAFIGVALWGNWIGGIINRAIARKWPQLQPGPATPPPAPEPEARPLTIDEAAEKNGCPCPACQAARAVAPVTPILRQAARGTLDFNQPWNREMLAQEIARLREMLPENHKEGGPSL